MHSGYNDNSQIQLQAAMHFVPWLEDALSNGTMVLPYSHSPLISYIDYGCATGFNTAQLFARVRKLLESTRAIGGVRSTGDLCAAINVPQKVPPFLHAGCSNPYWSPTVLLQLT
jgi:hypothetical protein